MRRAAARRILIARALPLDGRCTGFAAASAAIGAVARAPRGHRYSVAERVFTRFCGSVRRVPVARALVSHDAAASIDAEERYIITTYALAPDPAWFDAADPRAHAALRAREYARLDAREQVYLDYTGAALYADSHLHRHLALLADGVFGNPHSISPTSAAATTLTEQARTAVLRYFNAAPDEYEAIFTSNASGALKLVGEAYPFSAGDRYLLTVDNHNSVNGIREFARVRGAAVGYVPITVPDLRIDAAALRRALDLARPGGHNLFAYPAQSNFSGVQHDLDWIAAAQARAWDVLLDAAAFVPTNRLDLQRWHPDFVALSFYKLFGYPTGIGCLLARRTSLAKLRRPWFAGGTVMPASAYRDGHTLRTGAAGFEDGTIDFLNLPAIETGLAFLDAIGIDAIHDHVTDLTDRLLRHLAALHHRTGVPLVRIYGPATTDRRGSTVALNLQDRHGTVVDFRLVEQRATAANISLRTGCFCNPGVSAVTAGLSGSDLPTGVHTTPATVGEAPPAESNGHTPGAVRVSTGVPTNDADIDHFIEVVRGFLS